jgi:hypothetical protein
MNPVGRTRGRNEDMAGLDRRARGGVESGQHFCQFGHDLMGSVLLPDKESSPLVKGLHSPTPEISRSHKEASSYLLEFLFAKLVFGCLLKMILHNDLLLR